MRKVTNLSLWFMALVVGVLLPSWQVNAFPSSSDDYAEAAFTSSGALQISDQPMLVLDGSQVRYLAEDGAMTPEQALASSPAHWQTVPRKSINLGWRAEPVWVRFQVHNTTTIRQHRLLELRWTNLSRADFFQHHERDGSMVRYGSGPLRDGVEPYRDSTSFLFPVDLEPGEHSEILLRVASRHNIFLPLFIWQEDAFAAKQLHHVAWYCLGFGILLALMLYNLSLFIFTRDSNYFYYSLYSCSTLIYASAFTGFGAHYLWRDSEWLRLNELSLGVHLSFLTATVFVVRFLNIRFYSRWMAQVGYGLAIFWSSSLLLILAGWEWLSSVALAATFFSCLCALLGTVLLWRKGCQSARYFAIAWAALIFFTIHTVLMIEGYMPYTVFAEFGQIIGFVAEMLLLSLALAERINRERIERERSQQNALALQLEIGSERDAALLAREQMLLMQQQHNQELESRVTERTLALERTMVELEQANQELSYLSVMDGLTKIHNRRYFDDVLTKEMQRAARNAQPLALILVDIDHFKQFNDNYGHLAGDDCLRMVSATLRSVVVRSADLIARYGGEEFAVVLPGTSLKDAGLVAEKMRTEILNLQFTLAGKRVPISASLGVACFVPTQGCEPNQLIAAADAALYQAKHKGRNCTVSANLQAVG